MDKHPEGPYKHYKRPSKPRTSGEKPSGSHWGSVIAILIIILIILIPVVHHFASANNHQQAQEVERVKKASRHQNKNTAQSKSNSSAAAKKRAKQKAASSSSVKKTRSYLVKSGDTLSSIAQEHHMTVAQLAKMNKITDTSNLQAGQTLKVK